MDEHFGYIYLRVVLQAIKPPTFILNSGNNALITPRNDLKPLGQPHHLIPMAHPHDLPPTRTAEQPAPGGRVDLHLPVLLLVAAPHLPAEVVDEELHAVADAEDGDPVGADVVEEAIREGGGAGGVDGVGAAGEDDEAGAVLGDVGERGGAVEAEGEDGEGADPAGDEVRVLRPVVQDEDQVLRLHLGEGLHRRSSPAVVAAAVGREKGVLGFKRGTYGKYKGGSGAKMVL